MILSLKAVARVAAIGVSSLALITASVAQDVATDFSADSKASGWGVSGEAKAKFSGTVVDVLCELSGDCPDACGGGTRNLGIVRTADQKLIFVTKNSQPMFNGATDDLLPYCGKAVDVDGLMVGDGTGSAPVYLVELIREQGSGEFKKTTAWSGAWAKRNPSVAKGEGQWFRRDPRVQAQIEKDGYLGLGLEIDKKWIAENQ